MLGNVAEEASTDMNMLHKIYHAAFLISTSSGVL
jgi:hypothetical protein